MRIAIDSSAERSPGSCVSRSCTERISASMTTTSAVPIGFSFPSFNMTLGNENRNRFICRTFARKLRESLLHRTYIGIYDYDERSSDRILIPKFQYDAWE